MRQRGLQKSLNSFVLHALQVSREVHDNGEFWFTQCKTELIEQPQDSANRPWMPPCHPCLLPLTFASLSLSVTRARPLFPLETYRPPESHLIQSTCK